MIAKKLNDEQMRHYILNGYITVKTDHPPEFHEAIYNETEMTFEKEGNPGNNLVPRIPAIQSILNDPAVHGALTGILGPDYYAHPHRHCHFNPPGSSGQTMHKDSWARRHHHTRWLMALYYPQDTPEERGPTGILSGSHYYNTEAGSKTGDEVALHGEAGTVAIIHYDLWHRAMPNRTDKNRYMMKFLFTRMEEPQSASWDKKRTEWQPVGDNRDKTMWTHLWDWHAGEQNGVGTKDSVSIPQLIEALGEDLESVCFDAAYALGCIGAPAVPALIEGLTDESETMRRNASYALSAVGAPAVPALIEASEHQNPAVRTLTVETLGDIGLAAEDGIPVLIQAQRDESAAVRGGAVEALGLVSQSTSEAVPALVDALEDEDIWVRRNTSLALARLGNHAQEAIPALEASLKADNRYVRANCAHALYRMGTPVAKEILLDFLLTSRWCPSTTRESTF